MAIYGSRAKAAFNSLGMRPVEILDGQKEPSELGDIIKELKEDEEVETVLEPLVRKYFEVLNEKGMVEYDESGGLYTAGNRSLHKNGYSDEEIELFIESFNEDY